MTFSINKLAKSIIHLKGSLRGGFLGFEAL